MCWRGGAKDGFQVKAYYNALMPQSGLNLPWKSIWKSKAPPRVAFFVWTAALGRILTTDNLQRRRVIVLDYCWLCKRSGESISHLLLLICNGDLEFFCQHFWDLLGYALWNCGVSFLLG